VTLTLGIDPGSRRTGWAVISQQGRRLSVVDSGTINLPADHELAERLGQLQQSLEALLERTAPAAVAVEDIFSHRNARSALALGQARGVALAVAASRGVPVFSYPPATVKRAVCGHGRAEKAQVSRMAQALLGLKRDLLEDEADAMAVAICHALASRSRAAGLMEPTR
jgi:crossover junction endodeoxyribonuclease RuvC